MNEQQQADFLATAPLKDALSYLIHFKPADEVLQRMANQAPDRWLYIVMALMELSNGDASPEWMLHSSRTQ